MAEAHVNVTFRPVWQRLERMQDDRIEVHVDATIVVEVHDPDTLGSLTLRGDDT